jgi:DNA-binding NtrC family response regulator
MATPPPPASRVLIADDSIVCRGVLVILLENSGYDVISVFDGNQALAALRSHPFDLAILDNDMPNLGGLGTLTELRTFLPQLPVIVCSGTVTAEQAARYRELGIDELLAKPVDPRTLRTKIAHILARRHPTNGTGDLSAAPFPASEAASASSPLLSGNSLLADNFRSGMASLGDFRSVAILEGPPGSGRFELALSLAPASHVHKFVCHADELSEAHLGILLAPAAHDEKPVFIVILDTDRLDEPRQTLLEQLVRGRLANHAALSKRLRLVLCAEKSLCDLHFDEFLLMRAVTSTRRMPDFSARRQDWAEISRAILRRVGTGRGTFDNAALRWIENYTWPGNYMQLHRTIELARRHAGVVSVLTLQHLEQGLADEPAFAEPLFHDLLFHVHSGHD